MLRQICAVNVLVYNSSKNALLGDVKDSPRSVRPTESHFIVLSFVSWFAAS